MVDSVNNAGSQHALEGNWNDENAMRKFERATEGAARQRRDDILDNKQRPNSVELGAGSKSINQKSTPPPPATASSTFEPGMATKQSDVRHIAAPNEVITRRSLKPQYIFTTVLLFVIAVISGVFYLL